MRAMATAVLLAAMGLLVGCGPTSYLITPVPATQGLRERVVGREGLFALDKIAIVDVDGMMVNARESSLIGGQGENPVVMFKEKLDRTARDPAVKAVVLRINSPGGTVTASDIMYAELLAYKQRTGRPVVACMLDVAASGGYYLACGSDHIVAHPTTITGSIGVIMLLPNVSGTMQKIGMAVYAIKSGDLKDAGSPFRELDDQDRSLYQSMVGKMFARFQAVVRRGRAGLSAESLAIVADGRVVLGDEALQLGLVDELGTIGTAIAKAKSLAGLDGRPVLVVQYARPYEAVPNVYAAAPGEQPEADWPAVLPPWLQHSTPQMLYLWSPGW